MNARETKRWPLLFGLAAALGVMPAVARAQGSPSPPRPDFKQADPAKQGDGTLGEAASKVIVHGPLPPSEAFDAAKAAANRARDEAMRSGAARQNRAYDRAPTGEPAGR